MDKYIEEILNRLCAENAQVICDKNSLMDVDMYVHMYVKADN